MRQELKVLIETPDGCAFTLDELDTFLARLKKIIDHHKCDDMTITYTIHNITGYLEHKTGLPEFAPPPEH